MWYNTETTALLKFLELKQISFTSYYLNFVYFIQGEASTYSSDLSDVKNTINISSGIFQPYDSVIFLSLAFFITFRELNVELLAKS